MFNKIYISKREFHKADFSVTGKDSESTTFKIWNTESKEFD